MTILGLKFVGDAISLSGLTGTRLKCEVIRKYYPFWWKITSGGRSAEYQYNTAIVELNAATGEVFIDDINQTTLGSAGHALNLKVNHFGDQDLDTDNLKVILVEENEECYYHLKRVIRRRWPEIAVRESEGAFWKNTSNVYLINASLEDALEKIDALELGNAIYYFDPLLNVTWDAIEKVAARMETPFETGTELLIFLFTSDWFTGRDDFEALPKTPEPKKWTRKERRSVIQGDLLFGDKQWRKEILCRKPIETKEKLLVELYRNKLHKWFRYVLPMPFNPKGKQIFHLILCSNYEAGVKRTKSAYASETLNPLYKPNNKKAYKKYVSLHPGTTRGLRGNRRPLVWKILWKTIKDHEDGICDCACRDFRKEDSRINVIQRALVWLNSEGYLDKLQIEDAWGSGLPRYVLNWGVVKQKLGVDQPPELTPLSPEDFKKTDMGHFLELIKQFGKKYY